MRSLMDQACGCLWSIQRIIDRDSLLIMIIGIGSDLIDIRRIEKTLERFGERFIERCYTEDERYKRQGLYEPKVMLNVTAKEACAKALGTGLERRVLARHGRSKLTSGKPTMKLTGGALARLNHLVPVGMDPRIDLTMTDEPPIAEAL